jgi:rod shape-determining protein MreC
LTSTAILITDPNHALPIQINRTGVRTLALGTGKFQELELPHVPHNEDVKVGDVLVTSGMGGRFPRGYPVGTMTAKWNLIPAVPLPTSSRNPPRNWIGFAR